jgi:hypothetical protein
LCNTSVVAAACNAIAADVAADVVQGAREPTIRYPNRSIGNSQAGPGAGVGLAPGQHVSGSGSAAGPSRGTGGVRGPGGGAPPGRVSAAAAAAAAAALGNPQAARKRKAMDNIPGFR